MEVNKTEYPIKRNFNILWGFWIAEKELAQKKINVRDIIMKYYDVWVEEFFLWYNPPYWHNTYSFSISPNGRFWENENISSFETLKEAVEIIHSLKRRDWDFCKVLLTMNGWQYSDLAFPLMKQILNDANKLSIDGVIIWNFEWIQYLSEVGYTWRISISTILNTYNAEAIEFWLDFWKSHNLNIYRVVLPREVTLKEMAKIIPLFPTVNFEVFWQGDYCRYANGNCFAEHKYFSRDLCTFVLKQGMNVKKRVRYDFKEIISSPELSETKKQFLLNPLLEAIDYESWEDERLDYLFLWNPLMLTKNNLLFLAYDELQEIDTKSNNKEDKEELSLKILLRIQKELVSNKIKYIYDPIVPETNEHNKNVVEFISYFDAVLQKTQWKETDNLPKYEKIWLNIDKIVKELKEYMRIGKEIFVNEIRNRWQFGLETYYKFMLYNRTSAPFFAFFNTFENVDVVKIPLRWRDPSIFKLGIDLIDDAINNPEKYRNSPLTQSYKYFHYKPLN